MRPRYVIVHKNGELITQAMNCKEVIDFLNSDSFQSVGHCTLQSEDKVFSKVLDEHCFEEGKVSSAELLYGWECNPYGIPPKGIKA